MHITVREVPDTQMETSRDSVPTIDTERAVKRLRKALNTNFGGTETIAIRYIGNQQKRKISAQDGSR